MVNFRNLGEAGDVKDHTHMASGHQRGVPSVQVGDWTKLKDFNIWRHNTGQMWLLKRTLFWKKRISKEKVRKVITRWQIFRVFAAMTHT